MKYRILIVIAALLFVWYLDSDGPFQVVEIKESSAEQRSGASLRDTVGLLVKQIAIMENRQFQITSHFKSGHDLFVFGRFGYDTPVGYMYASTFEIDGEFLHKIIVVCDSAQDAGAPVDADFALQTLFYESRFAVPDHPDGGKHISDRNYYEWQFNLSTIHSYGWTWRQLEDRNFRLYAFIQYCKDNLFDVPRENWRICYRMGRDKYFKQSNPNL